ncbi:pyridoxamine 5'-phosphate oxidase family protein [Amnibacterium sp. CER49]|uniref:pyridoxamine 5'-phosphate oxidase family protein n=1 Tax=Amnibacterium sp. CER49 TaxID=3039161 RepID=UPI00244D7368|nr:pyridoxamine 5'-phosphate oxidase family protein [Amnibacterium sp. CER49]MDH2442788.1 pyridoxamine 5'-phosphate oxidase family protein [Amnibacterium sp. CER49]
MTDGTTEAQRKVASLVKGQRFAMLTTVDADGTFASRPMAMQEVEFDGDLWFFSEGESRKVSQIHLHPDVNVTVSSNDTWVSLNGRAEVVQDDAQKRRLWNKAVEAWFPDGPDSPRIALIKVHAEAAEYWDTPGGRVATLLSLAKAKATGRPYSGGENEQVEL